MTFQAASSLQGGQFAAQARFALESTGFTLNGPLILSSIGVEIDEESTSPNGNPIWFEFKGSLAGTRPGLMRTDTLKKAIANAALTKTLNQQSRAPFVVLTSHVPTKGAGLAMLTTALQSGIVDEVICLYQAGWQQTLGSL